MLIFLRSRTQKDRAETIKGRISGKGSRSREAKRLLAGLFGHCFLFLCLGPDLFQRRILVSSGMQIRIWQVRLLANHLRSVQYLEAEEWWTLTVIPKRSLYPLSWCTWKLSKPHSYFVVTCERATPAEGQQKLASAPGQQSRGGALSPRPTPNRTPSAQELQVALTCTALLPRLALFSAPFSQPPALAPHKGIFVCFGSLGQHGPCFA